MIDDSRWRAAVAELPDWVRARAYASIGEVELEWSLAAMLDPSKSPSDVRQAFFETLGGGEWDLVTRRARFRSIEIRYRLRR